MLGTRETVEADSRGCIFGGLSPHLHNGEDDLEEEQIFRDLWRDET
jgi:hypothetical protein